VEEATVPDDSIHTEAYISQRVKHIYDLVYDSYRKNTINANRQISTEQFTSAEYNNLLREATRLTPKDNMLDIPGADYDHWVMGQDWENLSIRTDSIRVLSPDTAEAYMCITNCGYPQRFMLMMTRDEKEWFIDDFRQYDEQAKGFAISDKRNIQDYINENPPSASEESLFHVSTLSGKSSAA
jgi:hypothetical protein